MAQFEKQTLIQGKKLYEAGKVVQVTFKDNLFKARVVDDKHYVVTFTISKNHKISKKTCSCHQDCCVHQAAAAYAFNDSRKAMPEEEKPKPPKKTEAVVEIPKHLSLNEYFLEIKKTAKRERDIHSSFMKELDQRLIDAMIYEDACQRVLNLIDDFSLIINYPKSYRNKVINRFKQSFDLLIDVHHCYQEIFTWLLNNRIRLRNREFDDKFQICIDHVDMDDIYQQVLFVLVNNDLSDNPYFQDLLDIYFQSVKALNIDLSQALVNIVKYRDQIIYKYYEIKNLIQQNRIEEANLTYNRINQKNNPWMIKIKEELDTYKINLEDVMDDTLRAISKKKNLKDIKELVATFKKKCGKEWNEYKEPFLNQLSQATTDKNYVAILTSEKEWYFAAKRIIYMENMYTFDQYSDLLWQYNKEAYYLLFIHCLEGEIKNTKNGYYGYVVERLQDLMIIQDVDKDIVVNMVYDLQHHFTTRKALLRTLDEFVEEDLS